MAKKACIGKILFIFIFVKVMQAVAIYECIKNSFQQSCKTQLYVCTNNPECSYQLNQNSQHVFLTPESKDFPAVYFSNNLAVQLYECLKKNCNLPQLNENYPSTLPKDACMIEVYSICGGNIQQIYQSGKDLDSLEKRCYQKYCNWD